MKFRNDKERIAFLEDLKQEQGWYRWKIDEDLGRVWWRRDFPDCYIVVETKKQTLHWPKDHIEYLKFQWYIVPADWEQPFEDTRGSRTLALKEIKRLEAEGKCI